MSLLPYLFDDSGVPTRRWNAQRGWLDSLVEPLCVPKNLFDLSDYFKNLNAALQDTGAQVSYDKDKFQVNFDVQHFKPKEISVQVNEENNTITIEGKHAEKRDEHGQIFRHFVRKYTLPKDCDIKKLESKLSSDGVLSVTAPKVDEHKKIEGHTNIPIVRTGQPAKSVEDKTEKTEK